MLLTDNVNLSRKKILLTGSARFVGADLCKRLLSADGKLPKETQDYLRTAWQEILSTEASRSYGLCRVESIRGDIEDCEIHHSVNN